MQDSNASVPSKFLHSLRFGADTNKVEALVDARTYARRTLRDAGLLEGWSVRDVCRAGSSGVLVDYGPGNEPGLVLSWSPVGTKVRGDSIAGRHFVAGAQLMQASQAKDEGLRARAIAACKALSRVEVSERDNAETEPTETLELSPRVVLARMEHDAWAEGWTGASSRPDQEGMYLSREFAKDAVLTVRVEFLSKAEGFAASTRQLALSIEHRPNGYEEQAEREIQRLALALEALGREVKFVPSRTAIRRRLPVTNDAESEALNDDSPLDSINLGIGVRAPCDQRCVFCGLDDLDRGNDVPVSQRLLDGFVRDIRAAARRGAKQVRINGIDPLAAPYLFELLETARASGYRDCLIWSPFTRCEDRAFARRLIAAMPERYDFRVPLYGATAKTHDTVVGKPGAFGELMRAMQIVREEIGANGRVYFETVVLPHNVDELTEIAALAWKLGQGTGADLFRLRNEPGFEGLSEDAQREKAYRVGMGWRCHLPHPTGVFSEIAYKQSVLQMTTLLETLYPNEAPARARLMMGEVPLCVALAHQRRTGHEVLDVQALRASELRLSGMHYATLRAMHSSGEPQEGTMPPVVQCPHKSSCSLGTICSAELYSAYVEIFGLGELVAQSESTVTSFGVLGDALLEIARSRTETE